MNAAERHPPEREPGSAGLTFPIKLRCTSVADLLSEPGLEAGLARALGRAFARARSALPAPLAFGSGVALQAPYVTGPALSKPQASALLARIRGAIEAAARSQSLPSVELQTRRIQLRDRLESPEGTATRPNSQAAERFDPTRLDLETGTYELPSYQGDQQAVAVKAIGQKGYSPPAVPARGTFTVRLEGGTWVYWYNLDDVKAWDDFLKVSFANYLKDAFTGATDQIAATYLASHPTGFTGTDPKTVGPSVHLFYNQIKAELHQEVTDWMERNHPEMTPKRIIPGTRKIMRQAEGIPSGAPTKRAEDDIEEVTVTGRPRRGGRAEQGAEGSPYGEDVGSPHGIIQYDPIGELKLIPELRKFVANSHMAARVWFETSHPFRAVLNIFPSHAYFDWSVMKDGRQFDTNWVGTGRIEYQVSLDGPGTYTIAVTVSSREFRGGKRLHLESPPICVVAGEVLERELFESSFVGAEPYKPFERDASGVLRVKPLQAALSVSDEIDGLNAQIAAVEEAHKEGHISETEAQKYIAFFKEQLKGLEKIQQEIGDRPYIVRGIFLNREDSSSYPVRAFMNQTRNVRSPDGHTTVDVVLYDSTLSPGEPRRHDGHGESYDANEDDAYRQAELDAISDMAGHWREYNELPDGTLRFAVRTMAGAQDVREWSLDTHTTRKTVKSVVGGVAAVGGVVLLAASVVTGGATAPVGILLLEGVVAGATVATVIISIDQRLATGTFHLDAQFVMDMTALVTVFAGVGGLAALSGATRTASNGMRVFSIGVGAFSFVMMSVETSNAVDRVNAQYAAAIQRATDPEEKRRLEAARRKELATIFGAASVSGALILVATGIAAKQSLRPKGGSAEVRQRPPGQIEPPVRPSSLGQPAALTPHVEEFPEGLVHLELTRSEAYQSYHQSLAADRSREVAIYFDPGTGEHIVVQGSSRFVGTEWFLEPGMQRSWQIVEHFHPGGDRYPSGHDFAAMMDAQINRGVPDQPVSTLIRWQDPRTKIDFFSEIGYTPGASRPYWVRYRNKSGQWVFRDFEDTPWNTGSDYARFLESEGIPSPAASSHRPPPETPAVPQSAATTAKLPNFSRAQRSRINDIEYELEKYHKSWTDLGFRDQNDVAAFFNSQASLDEGIKTLERRLKATIQIGSIRAEAQQPQEWRSRREAGAVETPRAKGPMVPEGQRLPRATEQPDAEYGGFWSGVRGDSDWFSDVEAVNKITNYEPIPFKKGFPNFSKWAKARVFGKVTGNDDIDFAAADTIMARRQGFSTKSAFERWRVANKLTWHHVEGMQEQQLVPFDLNDKVPHVGGAAQARATKP